MIFQWLTYLAVSALLLLAASQTGNWGFKVLALIYVVGAPAAIWRGR